jgi:hypothetical protein
VIDCKYYDSPYSSYSCEVQNNPVTTSKDSRDITGIRGNHQSGKTDNDVIHFTIYGKTANFFPRGITKYFKNINYVSINNANLKKITKEDLKEFGDNLKKLYLSYHQIEVIEADLFIYNKNLQEIYITDNKIKHIETGAFDHLKNLEDLHLFDNPCTSSVIATALSRSVVIKVIQNVEKSCKDQNLMVWENVKEIKTLRQEIEKLKENCQMKPKT